MSKKKAKTNKPFYLQRAELEGYKTIKHTKVDFLPGLNIIIGKNGTGKTNLFNFLYHALQLNYGGFLNFDARLTLVNGKEITLAASDKNFRRKVEEKQFLFDIDEEVDFTLSINNEHFDKVKYRREVYKHLQDAKIDYNNSFIHHGIAINGSPIIDIPLSFAIEKSGASKELYSLIKDFNNPDIIKKLLTSISFYLGFIEHSQVNTIRKEITSGFNIVPSIKAWLAEFSDIQDVRVHENFNLFVDTDFSQITINNLFFEYKIGDNWLPFSSLSDGTKRIFYIIAEVASPEIFSFGNRIVLKLGEENPKNQIILLEEPELGIHPHQLEKILQFLKEQAQTKQIIISTHSPIVLDLLAKDELNRVQIATLTKEGTQLRRLSEEEIEKAKIYMEETGFLSDYWRFSDLEV